MQSLRDLDGQKAARAARQSSRPRSPGRAKSRPRASIAGAALRYCAIAALAGGAAAAYKFGPPPSRLGQMANSVSITLGLGINQIAIVGSRNTLSDDIFAALALEAPVSVLTYDTSTARARLEALPWVASAQVSRQLPDGLEVSIAERHPYAVWQHKQLTFLIDADGRTLAPAARSDYPDLPLVVGDGADDGARDVLGLLARFPAIAKRVKAAIRVGGRRWDLQLKDAPALLLPEEAPAEALAWADRMEREERLFERRVTAIDLRIAGRAVFAVEPAAPAPAAKPGSRSVNSVVGNPDRGA